MLGLIKYDRLLGFLTITVYKDLYNIQVTVDSRKKLSFLQGYNPILNVIPSDQFNKTFLKVINTFFLSFALSPFFSFLAIIQHQ